MKPYLTTLILAATLLIGEIHTFWERGIQVKQNWIITRYEPMTIQWNVKFVGEELNWLLFTIAMLFYGRYPNRVNRITVGIFIATATLDIVLYFWNFKTVNYHYVYFGMAAAWAILYWWTDIAKSSTAMVKSIKRRLFG